MSNAGRVLSSTWGGERTVSSWFTAYQSDPAGNRIVHIPAGSRIRIGDFNSAAGVKEIRMQNGTVFRVRRSELDGRSDAVQEFGEDLFMNFGSGSQTAQPGNFTTRGIDLEPFMNSLEARDHPAEVIVTQGFVARNAAPTSPDVPLQRGETLLLKGYRAVDEQVALTSTELGWDDQMYFFAGHATVASSCLPSSEAMAAYRSPNPPANTAAQHTSSTTIPTAEMDNQESPGSQGASVAGPSTEIAVPAAVSSPVAGAQDEDMVDAEEEDTPEAVQMPPAPPAAPQPHGNPYVAALEALQPNGSFHQALLTRDELRALSSTDSKWTLAELQFRLASMVDNDFFTGFGASRISSLVDPADMVQLLPVHDPLLNPQNESFTAKSGRNYVATRVMSSAQGLTVHQGQSACVQCQKFAGKGWGKKRYCQCVTVVDAAGNSILGGACSNCAHGDHPEVCSFYSAD